MKVIVWTDRDIPNVALYNWVRVGSRNEVPGITGLAHFFEHMMFNGTSKRAAGRIRPASWKRRAAPTTRSPATMSPCTRTGFRAARSTWCSISKSDRLANLSFDPQVIESERGVVYSERRLRTEDSNEGFLVEQIQATAFVAHPYQIPTIGWPADIQSWKIEDLQKFFKTNYAPNNCTLVLVGDVSADEVFALAKKYLEPIPRQEPPPPVRTTEPEQLGEKRVYVQRNAQTPLLYVAYKSPAANDPQGPAINLLVSILTEGDSSRLHRLLVEEKKLAIEVARPLPGRIRSESHLADSHAAGRRRRRRGGKGTRRRAGTGRVTGRHGRGADARQEPVRVVVLETTRHHQWQGEPAGRSTKYSKATTRSCSTAPGAYEKVTRADVQKAAALVFQNRRRTVGILESPPQAPAAPSAPAASEAKP